MKKILYLSVFILLVLVLHTTAFADSTVPIISSYNATVSNENGAEYYAYTFNGTNGNRIELQGTLDFGTEIEVQTEEFINGRYYCRFVMKDNTSSLLYYIDMENVKIDESSIITSITPDYLNPHTFTVIEENGIPIHQGPAYIYDVIGKTIPNGKVITAYSIAEDNPWYFTTYEGVEGFICEAYGALGHASTEVKSLKSPVELKIYTKPSSNTIVGTLPANTEIDKFLLTDKWSNMYYIAEKKGYIFINQAAVIRQQIYERLIKTPSDGFALYEEASLESNVLISKIPKDVVLTGKYEQYDLAKGASSGWINVRYEDIEGWIYVTEDILEESEKLTNEQYGEVGNNIQSGSSNIIDENIINEEIQVSESQVKNPTSLQIPKITIICFVAGIFFVIGAIVLVKISNKKS